MNDKELQSHYDGETEALPETLDATTQAKLKTLEALTASIKRASEPDVNTLDSEQLFQKTLQAAQHVLPQPSHVFDRKPLFAMGAIALVSALLFSVLPKTLPTALHPTTLSHEAATAPLPVQYVQGTHVVMVDFGNNPGTVFHIEEQKSNTHKETAVIWISEI